MSTKWKALIIGAIFALFIFLLFFGRRSDFKVGERLPSWQLTSVDGLSFSFPDNRNIAIIHFWATFCDTCREEAEEMGTFYKMFRDQGVIIYAINIEPGNKEGIMEFARRYGWEFPVLLDPDNKVGKAFRITGVPETLVAGPDGRLLLPRFIGPVGWTSPLFRKSIEEAIKQNKR
jgi:peroxiredoxin